MTGQSHFDAVWAGRYDAWAATQTPHSCGTIHDPEASECLVTMAVYEPVSDSDLAREAAALTPTQRQALATLFSDEAETCETCLAEEFDLNTFTITDPGKFEGETLATFHAYHFMLDGFTDDDAGAIWRVGNVICEQSESGFVGGSVYDSDAEAEAAFASIESNEEEYA